MAIVMRTPVVGELADCVDELGSWQVEGAAMQLHPGDLGWFWRFGAQAVADAVRIWSRDGQILALGLLDGPDLLRLTLAPELRQDPALTQQLVADLCEPASGVFMPGAAYVEAPAGALLHDALSSRGWGYGESWTPLTRDLADPVQHAGVRIEVVDAESANVRSAVQRASFDTSTFTTDRWHAMAAGPSYGDARCLVAYDRDDSPVAAVTVWSAGEGKPGLIEPLGVSGDHRGLGYGKAISLAAAAALRRLGSSSAVVCTPSSNVAAIATYRSAGFVARPEVRDRVRP